MSTEGFPLCVRLVSLQRMRWQAWSWWRPGFPRSSSHCWQCPWCLCRFSYQLSSVNTQQGRGLWTSSTRPSPSGWDTQAHWKPHTHTFSKLKRVVPGFQVADRPGVRSAGVVDLLCKTRWRVPCLLLQRSAAELRCASGVIFLCYYCVVCFYYYLLLFSSHTSVSDIFVFPSDSGFSGLFEVFMVKLSLMFHIHTDDMKRGWFTFSHFSFRVLVIYMN